MNTKPLLWSVILGATLFTAGCGPTYGGRGYGGRGYGYDSPYRTYDPYYGGGYSDSYYGNRDPYSYGNYDNRSHREVHRDIEHNAEQTERKYEKGLRRLDRQEQEAREKAAQRFGGNPADPHYQESLEKIDRKYDHKREKVDKLREKGSRKLDREHEDYHRGW